MDDKIAKRLKPFDASATLGDPELLFKTFIDCLKDGDGEAAQEVLAEGLAVMNKSALSREYGISRRSLYNLITYRSSPSLELVAKACRALRLEAAKKRR
jgi:DNA-binding phage protein